jgi:flagellar protein FliS
MMFEGAIRFTRAGIDGIQNRKYDVANTNFKKAQAIIHELMASLNFDYDISRDLVRIYEYLLHQLIQANLKKDARIADEVLVHLQDILETWKEANKAGAQSQSYSAGTV